MARQSKHDLGKQAAALLATCLVVMGGLVTCITLAVLFLEQPGRPLAAVAGTLAAFLILAWLLRNPRDRSGRSQLSLLLARHRESEAFHRATRFGRRRSTQPPVQYGTNAPPTVEELRSLTDDSRTWVPRSSPDNR